MIKLFDNIGNQYNIDEKNEIARGGEGIIIDLNHNNVAKIYHDNIKPISEIKYNELLSLNKPEFIKPKNLLFDKSYKIKGFIMDALDDKYYTLFNLFNANFVDKNNFTDDKKKKVITKLIELITYAHSLDIIIGDLNPYNIMIDNNANVRFIDVDSYETKSCKHSGILLREIRDFYLNGIVSKETDLYALSVITFNLLTYLHPYKGVHKLEPIFEKRVIKLMSILKDDKDLIIPKCYKKITDTLLINQYEKIFNKGERFIIDFNLNINTIIKPIVKTILDSNKLSITEIFKYSNIRDIIVANDKNSICIVKDNGLLFIETKNKGYYKIKDLKYNANKVFLCNDNIFIISNNKFYYIDINDNLIEINNLDLSELGYIKTYQYNNILVLVGLSIKYTIYLDTLNNNRVNFKTESIYGKSIKEYEGLVQNIDGISYVLYEYKNTINKVKIGLNIKNIYQRNDTLCIESLDNNSIVYNLVKINDLSITKSKIDEFKYYDKFNENMVIIPEDNKFIIKRLDDFKDVAEYECNIINSNSIILNTNAGFICKTGDSIYLINSK